MLTVAFSIVDHRHLLTKSGIGLLLDDSAKGAAGDSLYFGCLALFDWSDVSRIPLTDL